MVKIVRKRLKLTDAELTDIIRRTGNFIPAISNQAGARHRLSLPKQIPTAAVIVTAEPEAAVSMQAEAV